MKAGTVNIRSDFVATIAFIVTSGVATTAGDWGLNVERMQPVIA